MKPPRIRERSWRFFRNWLLSSMVWLFFIIATLWVIRSPLHLVWGIPGCLVGTLVLHAYRVTHPRVRFRTLRLTPADAGLEYETVEFPSRDGLTLFGWYIPGSSRAVVVLVHGAGSSGIDMIYHAAALAAQGYGVLMFDLRAHARSDGDTCTYGWRETNDLLGAVDWVRRREDVDGNRIGVLGLSLGGQIALRAAAQSEAIAAVVAEGPSPAVLADHGGRPTTLRRWINYPFNWFSYAMTALMNGERPPAGVLATIDDIAPRPVLLIAVGRGKELYFTQLFYEAAKEPKALWEIQEGRHGAGFFTGPEVYADKVGTFFDAALLKEEINGA